MEDRSTGKPQFSTFLRFFKSEATGSLLLLFCTCAALLWANSRYAESYHELLHTKIGVTWEGSTFGFSLHHWINDALMVLFFFVVGLEIKREIIVGQLSSLRKAVLPVAAALGGMIIPAICYLFFNYGQNGARGWGIPMATDIAFALGILSLLGPRVPVGLKLFLTALAIADDLGAVLVIAVFYTEQIRVGAILISVSLLILIAFAQRFGIRWGPFYALAAFGVWLAVLKSGVHATVAGVLLAMVVPVRPRIQSKQFFTVVSDSLEDLQRSFSEQNKPLDRRQVELLEGIHEVTRDLMPAGLAFEHFLHPITAYFVIPLFALFNAGVTVESGLMNAMVNPVSLGVLVGLFVGKQLGVFLASWISIRVGAAEMHANVSWGQIYGAGILSGIGFTMSLFVAELAFPDGPLMAAAKIGILCASVLAGIIGYGILRLVLRQSQEQL
ncbi:MAG: Na+/H+ antiporter NhaA [Terriglobia bacterium]